MNTAALPSPVSVADSKFHTENLLVKRYMVIGMR